MTAIAPRITEITQWHVRLPLKQPYWSMITTLHAFDTLVVRVRLDNGDEGYGEAVIVKGYGHETLEGGWDLCLEQGRQWIGRSGDEAIAALKGQLAEWPHAVTCLVTAIEMAQRHPLLQPAQEERHLPLLGAVASHDPERIPEEIERIIEAGYRVIKVKVGQDMAADLRRVNQIQRLCAGRAKIRIDANQGYSRHDAVRFASSLEPEGIEMFEQGCAADDWDAALAIRKASKVPVMLDESIFLASDIARAADAQAADLIKLKLTKCGGLSWLRQGIETIKTRGMTAVLGNGVATDLGNWMEACVAHACIETTSEFNGFTRLAIPWHIQPLRVVNGNLVIPAGYAPTVDSEALNHHTVRSSTLEASST